MSLAASDFNSSPESVVSNRSGPMEYTDYRDGLPAAFISTQPRQVNNRDAVTNKLYCNLHTQHKPNIGNLSANEVEDRYNPLLTVTRGDCIGSHRGQFTEVPFDEALEKERRPSSLKISSSKPWEEQVDVDLRRCITEERVSIDLTGSVYFRRRRRKYSFFYYSGIPLYGHPLNADTPILRTVLFVPTKSSYISLKKYGQPTLFRVPSDKLL